LGENSANLVTLEPASIHWWCRWRKFNFFCPSKAKQTRVRSRVARWFVLEPKISIWVNFGASCNGNLGKIIDHLVYFTAIANILWSFGIFSGHLVYFSPFWYLVPRKIWQPWYAVGLGRSTSRGCQIILGTTFQNGENRPKEYT
jgi:hypothetical protein